MEQATTHMMDPQEKIEYRSDLTSELLERILSSSSDDHNPVLMQLGLC